MHRYSSARFFLRVSLRHHLPTANQYVYHKKFITNCTTMFLKRLLQIWTPFKLEDNLKGYYPKEKKVYNGTRDNKNYDMFNVT
jgi:hypothetical protein